MKEKQDEVSIDSLIYDIVAQLSYGGFLSDRITTEHAIEIIKAGYAAANQPQPNEFIEDENWQQELIGRVKDRFKELEQKEFQWHSFYHGWLEGRFDMMKTTKAAAAKDGQAKVNGSVFGILLNKEHIEAGDVVIAKGGDDFGIVKEVRYNDADEVEVHWLNTKTRASRTSIYFLYRCYRFSNQYVQAENKKIN